MVDLNELAQSLINRDIARAGELTRAAIESHIPAEEILKKGLVAGMEVVGDQFGKGEIYLPEVLMSGEATRAAMKLLRPFLTKDVRNKSTAGKVLIGTVQGDLHDIGKNLVIVMLEGAGFEVTDLGTDVPAERFAAAARQKNAQIVGLSALLTITMVEMKNVIRHLAEAGLRERVKVIIGGAPVTERFAREAGADGYATNAPLAVEMAKRLVGARQARK